MKTEEIKPSLSDAAVSDGPNLSSAHRTRVPVFAACAAVLIGAFSVPLYQLARLALREEIQSHILLIPFVFLYLWKLGASAAPGSPLPAPCSNIPAPRSWLPASGSLLAAAMFALFGFAALGGYWFWARERLSHDDGLSLTTISFLCFFYALAFFTLGWRFVSARLFALCFLIFLVPLPSAFVEFASIALQRASAEAASWMIALTGMPVLRDGLVFQFAGMAVRVAEECSGIRSTFVLFITSLLAGHLFLRTGWKKALLAFAIFPLGIARNGFRITAISWLSVNVDRTIIEGPLHHRGGPIFFVLSLIPLFALLWLLRRSDQRSRLSAAK